MVIFRIVQESLTNISRYAKARQVDITMEQHDNQLFLQVRDNGQGFGLADVASKKTYGLLGMRERALALGGKLEINSAPGQGTTIEVTIPLGADSLDRNAT